MPDLTELIQNALQERDAATATASADLHEITGRFSDAISSITSGAATLALEALDPSETTPGKGADPFALLLCWNQDERPIRVAELGPDGYPIKFFPNLTTWRERSRIAGDVKDRLELESYFQDLVSKRDSDVLAMLRFIIGNTPKQPAAAS